MLLMQTQFKISLKYCLLPDLIYSNQVKISEYVYILQPSNDYVVQDVYEFLDKHLIFIYQHN